jgi:hypothetical protein
MVFTELLISQGLSEEQVKEIIRKMSKNRIFITQEEKIEERYRKMKLQRDQMRVKLQLAEATLGELNRVLMTNKNMAIEDITNHEIQMKVERR